MHTISQTIYKILWLLTPVVFIYAYANKGQICIMYSCSGDDSLGMTYGIVSAVVYLILVKGIKSYQESNRKKERFSKLFWKIGSSPVGFSYVLILLLLILSFYLGKLSGFF
jgi:hypothetical protein